MLEDLCDITLSINFAKSEDSYSSDLPSPPGCHKKNGGQYKCFRCYGTGTQNCIQCQGSEKISNSHPLALLLNSLLMKKINFRKLSDDKDEQHEPVYIIKEEEEDTDEKKIICSFCQVECDYSLYHCEQCPWLHVCSRCQERSLVHHHQLIRNTAQPVNGVLTSLQNKKLCCSCGKNIESYHCVCKTCSSLGQFYWICDSCSDSHNYLHHTNHFMETVIDQYSFKENQMETISQGFSEELALDHSISLSSDKIDILSNELQLNKKNSSIPNLEQEDQSPLLHHCNTSLDTTHQKYPISRVKFEVDGLFSSYDFSSSKNILRTKSALKEEPSLSQTSKSNCKENLICPQVKEYLFSGYKCDVCQVQPIKNVRYHCSECEDFDVCEKCYDNIYQTHEHVHFDRIDGKELRERALEKVFNCRQPVRKTNLNLSLRMSNRPPKAIRINTLAN